MRNSKANRDPRPFFLGSVYEVKTGVGESDSRSASTGSSEAFTVAAFRGGADLGGSKMLSLKKAGTGLRARAAGATSSVAELILAITGSAGAVGGAVSKIPASDELAAAAAACTCFSGIAGCATSAGVLSKGWMVRAGSSFRTRLTAVRMVVLAWSLATGLVRISSAPRRNAVGSPARPSTMAMGTGLVPSWERRQTSKINFAAGRFSQSTNTRSKLWELSFLAADGPSRGRSNVTDISSSTPVMALTAWSSGDKSRAWGIAFNARNPAPDPQVTQVSGEPLTDPPARRGRESERETGPSHRGFPPTADSGSG